MKVAALIPAYQAARTIERVVADFLTLAAHGGYSIPLLVVDDGSTDGTAKLATRAGARVLRHPINAGKGSALCSGFQLLSAQGFDAAVTLDADAQHPVEEALRIALWPAPQDQLILGIRNLARDGAPRGSQFSNALSNLFISRFAGMTLRDTQCGLRRYPLAQTLALQGISPGYAFEAEIILRAAHAHWTIEQVPVAVVYPTKDQRMSHFHVVRDPARIVFRVLQTWLELDVS